MKAQPAPWQLARICRAAAVLLLTLAPGADAHAAGVAKLSEASGDQVHASTVVPDATRKVGQVRLLSRGDAVVVQTLLSTKVLARVIAEIGKKEEHNWPAPVAADGKQATPDSSPTHQYLEALSAAREKIESRDTKPVHEAVIDRRRNLLIEFVADTDAAAVFVGTFASDTDGDPPASVRDREIFTTLELPRAYILREIRLILSDSFKVDEADVDRLGPLGPAASGEPAAKPAAPADPAR